MAKNFCGFLGDDMECKHCPICASSRKCTKIRHVCQIRFLEKEAIKDIKPVKWKPSPRN